MPATNTQLAQSRQSLRTALLTLVRGWNGKPAGNAALLWASDPQWWAALLDELDERAAMTPDPANKAIAFSVPQRRERLLNRLEFIRDHPPVPSIKFLSGDTIQLLDGTSIDFLS